MGLEDDASGDVDLAKATAKVTDRRRGMRRETDRRRAEALQRMVQGLAHDLNGMLGMILTQVESLGVLAASGDDVAMSMAAVHAAVRHGEGLVESIATIAHDQSLEYDIVDVNVAIEDAADFIRSAIPPTVTLTIDARAQGGEALLLRGSLERVLLNAAFNAAHAMPDGGSIVVSTSNEIIVGTDGEHDPRERAELFVVVRVVDDGIGVDAELGKRAFEPGFTTRSPASGHGLGLSTCRQLVQACGGSLELTGQPGTGSTLTVRYPCALPAAAS